MSTLTEDQKQQWQEHIAAYQKSGLSKRRYCREANIAYHQFQYYWKQHCKKQTVDKVSEVPSRKFVPLTVASASAVETRLEKRGVKSPFPQHHPYRGCWGNGDLTPPLYSWTIITGVYISSSSKPIYSSARNVGNSSVAICAFN